MARRARSPEDPPPTGYRYLGGSDLHFMGVPARDLTAEDLAILDDDTKKALLASGVYEEASDA